MTVTLHHEMNNPLMAATAAAALLQRDASGLGPAERESLDTLQEALERIAGTLRKAGDLQSARPVDYIEGIRMIALDEAPVSGRMEQRGEAVLWIPDRDLARVVSLLLRHGGFTVRTVQRPGEIAAAAARLGVTMVLIAPPAGVPVGFAPPAGRLWTLMALAGEDEQEVCRTAGVDAVMTLPIDPGSFTEDVLRTLDH